MAGFGIGVGGQRGHDRLENAEGGGLLFLDRRVLNDLGFRLACEVSVQSGVDLVI